MLGNTVAGSCTIVGFFSNKITRPFSRVAIPYFVSAALSPWPGFSTFQPLVWLLFFLTYSDGSVVPSSCDSDFCGQGWWASSVRCLCMACSFAGQLVYSLLNAILADFLVSSEWEACKCFLPAHSLSFPPLQMSLYKVQVFSFDEV